MHAHAPKCKHNCNKHTKEVGKLFGFFFSQRFRIIYSADVKAMGRNSFFFFKNTSFKKPFNLYVSIFFFYLVFFFCLFSFFFFLHVCLLSLSACGICCRSKTCFVMEMLFVYPHLPTPHKFSTLDLFLFAHSIDKIG